MSNATVDLGQKSGGLMTFSLITDPRRRNFLRAVFGALGMLAALCWFSSEKSIKHFRLGYRQTLSIYTQSSFAPEAYYATTCEIVDCGTLVAPRCAILVEYDERPAGTFAVERSTTTQLVALTYTGNVVFIYDFRTGHTWPDRGGETDEINYLFLVKSLAVFHAEGKDLPCLKRRYFEEEQRKL